MVSLFVPWFINDKWVRFFSHNISFPNNKNLISSHHDLSYEKQLCLIMYTWRIEYKNRFIFLWFIFFCNLSLISVYDINNTIIIYILSKQYHLIVCPLQTLKHNIQFKELFYAFKLWVVDNKALFWMVKVQMFLWEL